MRTCPGPFRGKGVLGPGEWRRFADYRALVSAEKIAKRRNRGLWRACAGEREPDFYDRHGVVISAVIVRSDELTPGHGLYALAEKKGWLEAGESEAAMVERLQSQLLRKSGTC